MIVAQAGIDTWSPCWRYAEGSRTERALKQLASVRIARGAVLPEKIAGYRVGHYPAARMMFVEGHPGGEELGNPDELPSALCAVEQALADHGIATPPGRARSRWGGVDRPQTADLLSGFLGVRRLDATADLSFESSPQGLAVLAGVAAMELPRSKSAVWRSPDRFIETVAIYGSTGKKMLGRWYDKGVESGQARRGHLIRPEDQRRFDGQTRRAVEELTSSYVREKFQSRFLPLWKATKGVTVAGPMGITDKLGELIDAGALSCSQAESLAGHLFLRDDPRYRPSRRTRYRRRADLREHGLVLADGVHEEVEVDLHEVLEQVLDSDAWGAVG